MQLYENRSIDEWTKFKIRIQYLKNELKFSKDLVSSTQLKLTGESATLQIDAYLFEQFRREKVMNIIPDKNCIIICLSKETYNCL